MRHIASQSVTFPYRESSRASDVLQPVLGLLLPSVNVRRRPLTAAAIVTQLALDIPAGRPFRAENRGWLASLTPLLFDRLRSLKSRALGAACGVFSVASSTRISFCLSCCGSRGSAACCRAVG